MKIKNIKISKFNLSINTSVDGFNIANAKIKYSTLLFAFNKNIVAKTKSIMVINGK